MQQLTRLRDRQGRTRVHAMAAAAVLLSTAMAAIAQSAAEEPQQSLYDRLVGLAPIFVVVSDFIDVLVPDPVLNANPAIIVTGR